MEGRVTQGACILKKLKEFIITLRMEKILKKNKIFEICLDTIELENAVFG